MATRILSEHPAFFTGEELQHCPRALATISTGAQNLERIFEAAGARSADEFRQAMQSIRRLSLENIGN
jgi:hypothetical protein